MADSFLTHAPISALIPKPGIVVCYSRIPAIIDLILPHGNYHNYRSRVNEIFQKTDFSSPFLSDGEIITLNRFKALKKQVEWVCGRYLVKQMLARTLLKNFRLEEIRVSYLARGAPFITGRPEISLSISHSQDYTAAALRLNTDRPIGLDIEKIGSLPDDAFMRTAFSQKEISYLKKDPISIFTAWTIKEAYLKYIRQGFNESLHHVEVIQGRIFHRGQETKVTIDIFPFDPDYILSLVHD